MSLLFAFFYVSYFVPGFKSSRAIVFVLKYLKDFDIDVHSQKKKQQQLNPLFIFISGGFELDCCLRERPLTTGGGGNKNLGKEY